MALLCSKFNIWYRPHTGHTPAIYMSSLLNCVIKNFSRLPTDGTEVSLTFGTGYTPAIHRPYTGHTPAIYMRSLLNCVQTEIELTAEISFGGGEK